MLPRCVRQAKCSVKLQANILQQRFRLPVLQATSRRHFLGKCAQKGMVKNTYGTGCFMLMNIGQQPVLSKNNLITTIAWKIGDEVQYALEGSIFIGGAVVQWLRDGLQIISTSADVEELARKGAR